MKVRNAFIFLFLILFVSVIFLAAAAESPPADPGWPRVIEKNGNELTIYQPQVDFWNNYAKLGFRCALSVKSAGAKEEKFGIAEIEADTVTDHGNRTVVVRPQKRELRFPNIAEAEANVLRGIVNELHPPVQAMTVSLDRILTYLEPEKQSVQQSVDLNLDPPKIFYSAKPAILVIFLGGFLLVGTPYLLALYP